MSNQYTKKELIVSLKAEIDESGLAEKGMGLFLEELFNQYRLERSTKTDLIELPNFATNRGNMTISEVHP